MKNEQYKEQEVNDQDVKSDSSEYEAQECAGAVDPDADKTADTEPAETANTAAAAEEIDWKDKYMRLSAEFDNFRKRTLKEKMDLLAFGGEDVIVAILPVLDDFERAIEAMDKSDNIDSARQGMHLIQQKLVDTLQKKGVECIESNGADFDTDLHEAITKFPSEDQKGKVIDTVQKGYKLKDKVIRFCKVVVGE